jgi:phenylacetaldehyde dehydrogenase
LATEMQVSPAAMDFVARDRQMLIGGNWVDAASGKTFEVFNPATGDVLANVAEGDSEDIDRAVKTARAAFDEGPWGKMTPSERGRAIHRIGDLILEHGDELAALETLDNGKPMGIARAADIPLAADNFHYYSGWTTKLGGETIQPSVAYMPGAEWHAYSLREPVGVVGQIIPWNFPLLMAAWKLGPALAAGCAIVLKPAEQTPLSALRLGELILEAGIPEGVVNIVPGYGETAGAALAAHDDVDKVAFTGSTEVGKMIVQAAAGNLKKVTLELGGKSPNVVYSDANMETAIPGAANAIFFNHGQCCAAGSRLFVEKKSYDAVLEGVSEHAKKIKVGSGLDPQTEMGPLVSREQYERVTGYLDSGRDEGAKAVAGGKGIDGKGYFVEPTVLSETNPKMRVQAEEIFGPVVTVTPFDDVSEVPVVGNKTKFGLAAGIWTQDLSKAHRTARQLRAGTVWINCYNVFDAALPFGGYKESGWGREMGAEALENYTETKAVCIQL